MPQIDQIASIYASQLFWLVVVFAFIYFGIGRAMLPKIQRTVDDRDARIRSDIAAAETARFEADAAESVYQTKLAESRGKALSAVTAAKSQANAFTEARVRSADLELAERISHAERTLAEARAKAVAQIEQVAIEATQEITQKVAGLAVDRTAATTAVADALARA